MKSIGQLIPFIINVACTFLFLFVFSVFPDGGELYLSPFSWGGPLLLYAVLFIALNIIRKPLYSFVPPSFDPGRLRKQLPLRPGYFLFNSHFLVLAALCSLMALSQSTFRSVEEEYPVMRGNILLIIKNNIKTVDGQGKISVLTNNADNFGKKLSYHVIQGIKQSINAVAEEKAEKALKEKKVRDVEDLLDRLSKFKWSEFLSSFIQRVRYRGKPPMMLYNLTAVFYSGNNLLSSEVFENRDIDDDHFRNDPLFFKGPLRLKELTVSAQGKAEEYVDDDMVLSKIPGMEGYLPDSTNFLRYFYGQGKEDILYADKEKKQQFLRGNLEPPGFKTMVIWVSDDGYEPASLESYSKKTNFISDRRANVLSDDAESLKQRFFHGFLGPSCLIYYQGLKKESVVPKFRDGNIFTNLGGSELEGKILFNRIIEMPDLDYRGNEKTVVSEGLKRLKGMHPQLRDFIRTNSGSSLDLEILTLKKEAESFELAQVFLTVIVPLLLWVTLMVARYFFFIRLED